MRRRRTKTLSHGRKRRYTPSLSLSLFALVLGLLAVVLLSKVVMVSIDESSILGTTVYFAKGEDSNGSSGSSTSSNDDSNNDSGSGSGSSGSGSNGVKSETRSESGVRTETETKKDESRTEVRLSETERIRTRTKDGRTRIDITSGDVKVRLEQRDDRIIVKAEREGEGATEAAELEDETILKIEERLGKSGIKVATAGANQFVIQRGGTGALTQFPLSIDLVTNTLTVNTPSGQKPVAVLPDQAVQNLIAANVVSRLGGQEIVNQVQNNNLSSISQLVTLGEQNNIPVYQINGISDQRLLGFIPVEIPKTVTVSAETGQVISTQQSFVGSLIDVFSF